jgi:hypothetical protein
MADQMANFKSKHEKAEFLKGLVAGKRSLDEITGQDGVEVWMERPDGTYEGGRNSAYEGGDGINPIIYTREQFEPHCAKHPHKLYIILVDATPENATHI